MASRRMRSFERNHYFYGKLMTARDFKTEQEYHREKQWLHTRLVHDFGVVGGLKVRSAGDAGNPWRLLLEPGLAVDSEGREIVVPEPFEFDLSRLMYQCGLNPSDIKKPVYLTLAYRECEAEPVPVYARENAADEGYAPNRVQEGYTLAVTDTLPATGVGVAQEITDMVAAALKPMDLGAAYRRMGGVGIPPAGAVCMAAAADSEDVLVGASNESVALVTASNLSITNVGATEGNVVAMATAPGVAWIATATTVRMAQWPAGSLPTLTLSWNDQEISAIAAHPVTEESKNMAYYLAKIPALDAPELVYWRLARVTSDGTLLELQQMQEPTKCLTVSDDGKTLHYAQQLEGKWRLVTYDLATRTATLEAGELPQEPISLHAGQDEEKRFVLAVMAGKCQVHEIGQAEPKELTLPQGFVATCGALQGRRALLAGTDTVAQQPVLQIYDLVESRRITHMWLLGSPRAIAVLPSPSYRVYVGTNQGVEVIDVPVQTNDLYRLLAERSLALDVASPKAFSLVLASVPLRNGLPDVAAIDNVSYRRVLVGTADLLGILSSVTAAVAKGTVGPAPSGQFTVVPEVVSSRIENRKYTVRVRALVKDFEGRPAPAGVAVTWSLTSDLNDGNLVSDVSFTDPSGVALVTVTALTPDVSYSISALVGGRGESAVFKGELIHYTYSINLSTRNLERGLDGYFSANVTAVIKEDGLTAPKDLPVTWTITPDDGSVDSTTTRTDATGVSANIVKQMKVGTTYTVTAAVAEYTAQTTIAIPAATPREIVLEPQPYEWLGSHFGRQVKATVKDQWGFPIANAAPVTWSGDVDFEHGTTTVDEHGTTVALASGFSANLEHRITAACGSASASVSVVPRAYGIQAALTRQEDGRYTAQVQAATRLAATAPLPPTTITQITWVLDGPGSLGSPTSETDGTGTAAVQIANIPFGQQTRIFALGADGFNTLSIQPDVAAVSITAGPCEFVEGRVVRKLTARVLDNTGNAVANAPDVTWSDTAGLQRTTVVNARGESENYTGGLALGAEWPVTATCRTVTGTFNLTTQGYTLKKNAGTLSGGLYTYDVSTVRVGTLGAFGAGKTISWHLAGPGRLSVSSSVTDDSGYATVQVLDVPPGELTLVFGVCADGAGVLQVGTQVASVSIETAGYDLENLVLVRKVTAVVRDRNGRAIAHAGAVNWTASTRLEAGSASVGADGTAGNKLYDLTPDKEYTVTAECEGASVTVTMTPRRYAIVVPAEKVTQQEGGLYTIQCDATIRDKDGNPAGEGKSVRWLLGTAASPSGTSTTNRESVASTVVSGLPFDQSARVHVLGDEGYGMLDVRPQVQRVQVEAAGYAMRDGRPAARLTARAIDNFGLAVRKALPVNWQLSGQGVLVAADTSIDPATGSSTAWATQVVRGAEFVADAACYGTVGQLRAAPRDLPVEFRATVLADGSYSVLFDAWGQDQNGDPVGERHPITFVLAGSGTLSGGAADTDAESRVQVTVTNLLMNQTAKLTVFGEHGWGYQEVMPQPKRVSWSFGAYEWHTDHVAQRVTVSIIDVWEQTVPTGTITWNNSLESDSTPIMDGVATNYVIHPEPGVTVQLNAGFAGHVYTTWTTSAAYSVVRTENRTSIQADDTYRVELTATTAGQITGAVTWSMTGGGTVESASSAINNGIATSAVKGLVQGGTYAVYAIGAVGFGKLVIQPSIQSVDVQVGDLEYVGGVLRRMVDAQVRDNFGLTPMVPIAFALSPGTSTGSTTTNLAGRATMGFSLQAGTTYTFTVTAGTKSTSVSKGSTKITYMVTSVNNQVNGLYGAYDMTLRATGPANMPLQWTLEAPSGVSDFRLGSFNMGFNAGGTADNSLIALKSDKRYTLRAIGKDAAGQEAFGLVNIQRQPTQVDLTYNRVSIGEARLSGVIKDSWGGVPGLSYNWVLPGGSGNAGGTSYDGSVAPVSVFSAGNGSAWLQVIGYTPQALINFGSGSGSNTTYLSSGSGTMSFASLAAPSSDRLQTSDAQSVTSEPAEMEPLAFEPVDAAPMAIESLEASSTETDTMSLARLASAPTPTDAEVALAPTVTLRAAGAMHGEGDLYSLKVIATVKSAEGVPAVGIPVTWEGVPAEQIQAYAGETDQFGMATAMIHGLKPTEVYGITAVAGDGRDTLFADQTMAPTYWLYVTPVPVDETGEAGFAIDLRDPEGVPVKGATVRYEIRGGGESKAGKLITSRALEPKPVVVMGLKPGGAYEIEVSGKDVIATLSYQP